MNAAAAASDLIKWVVVILVKVGFWASVVFTFMPILTIIISAILITLNGTVLLDLFYMVQMWLPFNFNVVLLWLLTLSTAFIIYWIAVKLYSLLLMLVKD